MSRLLIAIATLAGGLLAIGCSGAAPATGNPTGPQGVATPAATTGVASTPAAGTPAQPTAPAGSVDDLAPHEFPDLEARVPDSVAGVPIEKASFGADFGEGALSQEFTTVLAQFGRSAADVQLASAGSSQASDRDLSIVAFRVVGVDAAQFLAALKAVTEAGTDGMEIGETTLAGKNVFSLSQGGATQYAYASGDVFFVVGGEQALMEATLALIP